MYRCRNDVGYGQILDGAIRAIANPSGRSVYSLATVLILPEHRRAPADTWAVIRTGLL